MESKEKVERKKGEEMERGDRGLRKGRERV